MSEETYKRFETTTTPAPICKITMDDIEMGKYFTISFYYLLCLQKKYGDLLIALALISEVYALCGNFKITCM